MDMSLNVGWDLGGVKINAPDNRAALSIKSLSLRLVNGIQCGLRQSNVSHIPMIQSNPPPNPPAEGRWGYCLIGVLCLYYVITMNGQPFSSHFSYADGIILSNATKGTVGSLVLVIMLH